MTRSHVLHPSTSLLGLALLIGPSLACGVHFSDSEQLEAFGERDHRRITYDKRFPDAINALIHECNSWPLEVSPDAPVVDLGGHCTNQQKLEVFLSSLGPEVANNPFAVTVYEEAFKTMDLRIDLGDAFPDALHEGVAESLSAIVAESDLPSSILDCDFRAAVSVNTDFELSRWNLCKTCEFIEDNGCVFNEDDPRCDAIWACGYVQQGQSFDEFWGGHCAPPDLEDMATLVLKDIRTSWDEHGVAPALKLDIEFAEEMKISEMWIRAGFECDGIASDLLENYGGTLNVEGFIRQALAEALPLGRYDVFVQGLRMEAWFPLWVNRGEISSGVRTEATLVDLVTDRPLDPWELTDFLSLGGTSIADLRDDVASNFADNLEGTDDNIVEFITGPIKGNHRVCSVDARRDPWTYAVQSVSLHTAPIGDSCLAPDNSIGATDLPWCTTVNGKLLCASGAPVGPGGWSPEDYGLDEEAADFTWMLINERPPLP